MAQLTVEHLAHRNDELRNRVDSLEAALLQQAQTIGELSTKLAEMEARHQRNQTKQHDAMMKMVMGSPASPSQAPPAPAAPADKTEEPKLKQDKK